MILNIILYFVQQNAEVSQVLLVLDWFTIEKELKMLKEV